MFGGNFGNSLPVAGAAASQGTAGPDLADVETDHLAFQAAEITSGDRLKLVPSPWPADNPPPPTASLLSIASTKGLLAAAGPDSLVIASTDKLRASYIARRRKKDATNGLAEDEAKFKLHDAEVRLPIPRLSHLAFNADESCLVIAAEQGGGLAVYDTNALTSGGGREPAFQLATNGTSVRHLIPNPSADPSLAYFFGVVLTNGQFLLADLQARKLVNNASGSPVLHEGAISAAWSKLGKQIVVGLEDGSAVQIDREGAVKGQVPKPPQLAELKQSQYDQAKALPLTSIAWLANTEFLLIYTPFNPPNSDAPTDSVYFIAKKAQKDQPYTFHRLIVDPVPAFMPERTPAHHFISRLNNWKPGVNDVLILASSASFELGVFANFAESGEMLTAFIKDEGRRATLPMGVESGNDTTPIGMAFDYSVQELAPRPIPAEVDLVPDSRSPLPALCALNTEGVLSIWWVIYDDAIRQNERFPAMTKTSGSYRTYDFYSQDNPLGALAGDIDDKSNTLQPQSASTTTSLFSSSSSGNSPAPTQPAAASSFGKPAFGAPSTPSAFGATGGLGKPASVWGTPSASSATPSAATPAFGQASSFGAASSATAAPAFGKPSFGTPSAPAAAPAFGKPSFGSTSAIGGSAFGQASGIGAAKASPWGAASPTAAASNTSGSAFGKFGAGGQASGFAAFAGGNASSPFGAAAGQQSQNKPSPFSNTAAASPFAAAGKQAGNNPSPFGTGAPVGKPAGLFGAPAPKPALNQEISMGSTATLGSSSTSFSFGQPSVSGTGSFVSKPALSKEDTMEEDGDGASAAATPAAKENSAPSPFGLASGGFKLGTTFKGDGTAKDDLPRPANPGAGLFGSGFGNALSSTTNSTPSAPAKESAAEQKSPEPGKPAAASPFSFVKKDDAPSTGFSFAKDGNTPSSGFSFVKKDAAPSTSSPFAKKEPESAPASSPFAFIKKEPGTEETPSLKDIPAAPEQKGVPDDAPLPPDPTTFKAPGIPDDLPLPPDPTTTKGKSSIPDDMPLPPDPTPSFGSKPLDAASLAAAELKKDAPADAVLAGSPPVDLGSEKFPPPATREAEGPEEGDWEDEDGFEDEEDDEEEDDEEGEDEDEDEEDEEDEDEDEDEEHEEDDGAEDGSRRVKIADPAGLEAFKRRITPASPKAPKSPNDSTTPPTAAKPSYTPAGMPRTLPKGPTFAPPTNRPLLSPRSPSPVRAVTSPVGRQGFLAEPIHSQIKATAVPPAKPLERRASPPKEPEPTAYELQDQEDDRIKAILQAPAEPIKDLEAFLTHQEYTGSVDSTGIPSQIEKVFRDVNSMIDVAGLNARHIRAFVDGHTILRVPGARTVDDLEDGEQWVLADLEDIPSIVSELDSQLSEGQLRDPQTIVAAARTHEQELLKLKHKTAEMRKTITAHSDPERVAAQEAAPLSAETQAQQAELRQRAQDVQKLLTAAEEKLSLLRADIASASAALSASRDSAPSSGAAPTVEAVMNTIRKMTAMVEQQSGDIDVLEAQLRRLPAGLAALRLDDGGLSSSVRRNGSPTATPPPSSRRRPAGEPLGMSGMFGPSSASRFRTPPSASVLGRGSIGYFTPEGSARKKLGDVTPQEVVDWERKNSRRKAVLAGLKSAVVERGVKVVRAE